MRKRIWSICLAIAMMVGSLPVVALAEADGPDFSWNTEKTALTIAANDTADQGWTHMVYTTDGSDPGFNIVSDSSESYILQKTGTATLIKGDTVILQKSTDLNGKNIVRARMIKCTNPKNDTDYNSSADSRYVIMLPTPTLSYDDKTDTATVTVTENFADNSWLKDCTVIYTTGDNADNTKAAEPVLRDESIGLCEGGAYATASHSGNTIQWTIDNSKTKAGYINAALCFMNSDKTEVKYAAATGLETGASTTLAAPTMTWGLNGTENALNIVGNGEYLAYTTDGSDPSISVSADGEKVVAGANSEMFEDTKSIGGYSLKGSSLDGVYIVKAKTVDVTKTEPAGSGMNPTYKITSESDISSFVVALPKPTVTLNDDHTVTVSVTEAEMQQYPWLKDCQIIYAEDKSTTLGVETLDMSNDTLISAAKNGCTLGGKLGSNGAYTSDKNYPISGSYVKAALFYVNQWGELGDAKKVIASAEVSTEASDNKPAAPKFDSTGGSFRGTKTITITAPEGAGVYYTTDGTDPKTSETKQEIDSGKTAQITITETTTIKAVSYVTGGETTYSDVVEASFRRKASSYDESSGDSGGGGGSSSGKDTAKDTTQDTVTDETKDTTTDETKDETKDTAESEKTIDFTDVTEKDWFYDDVQYVYGKDLMKGVSESEFGAKASTTRGMIVTVLYRLDGSPEVSGAHGFTDVAEGSYFEKAITWAVQNGIAVGYGDGKFCPNQNITREQLAAILFRFAEYKGIDVTEEGSLAVFADGSTASAYAVSALRWAVAKGLVYGQDGNILNPRGEATRAQVAAVLHRFVANIIEK